MNTACLYVPVSEYNVNTSMYPNKIRVQYSVYTRIRITYGRSRGRAAIHIPGTKYININSTKWIFTSEYNTRIIRVSERSSLASFQTKAIYRYTAAVVYSCTPDIWEVRHRPPSQE